jgi:hypothetical protein
MSAALAVVDATDAQLIPMTKTEARGLVEKIKSRLASARALILDLSEREGWKALGYPSWRACVTAEFPHSAAHLYRILEAAKVERNVSPTGDIGSMPERQLRSLAGLEPDEQREAIANAKEHVQKWNPGGKLTTRNVEAAVHELRDAKYRAEREARKLAAPESTVHPAHDPAVPAVVELTDDESTAGPTDIYEVEMCEVTFLLYVSDKDLAESSLDPANIEWQEDAVRFFEGLRRRKIRTVA